MGAEGLLVRYRPRAAGAPRSDLTLAILLVCGLVGLVLWGMASPHDERSRYVYAEESQVPHARYVYAEEPQPVLLRPQMAVASAGEATASPTAAPQAPMAAPPGPETAMSPRLPYTPQPFFFPVTLSRHGEEVDLDDDHGKRPFDTEPPVTRVSRGHEIFGGARHFLLVRYNLEVHRQPLVHMVSQGEPRVSSGPGEHDVYLVQGMEGDAFWARASEMYALCWYAESGRRGGPDGFAMWCAFKVMADRRALEVARAIRDGSFEPTGGAAAEADFRSLLEIEREHGEYGVLHYVVYGTVE